MGIFNAPVVTQTNAQIALAQLTQLCVDTYNSDSTRLALFQQLFWTNPYGFTPQQVATSLTTNAGMVYTYFQALQAALNAAVPATNTFVAPHAITINGDGTITVGA